MHTQTGVRCTPGSGTVPGELTTRIPKTLVQSAVHLLRDKVRLTSAAQHNMVDLAFGKLTRETFCAMDGMRHIGLRSKD